MTDAIRCPSPTCTTAAFRLGLGRVCCACHGVGVERALAALVGGEALGADGRIWMGYGWDMDPKWTLSVDVKKKYHGGLDEGYGGYGIKMHMME